MLALYPGGICYRRNCHKSTEEHQSCAKVTQLICNQQWVLWNVRYYRMYKHRSDMEVAYLVPWVRNWPLQNFHQQRNRLSFNSVSCHNIFPWLNYSKNSYIIFWHFLWQRNQRLAWTRRLLPGMKAQRRTCLLFSSILSCLQRKLQYGDRVSGKWKPENKV